MRTLGLTVAMIAGAMGQELYKNPDAPLEARVADLVSRMTVQEKVAQMQNAAPAIPRLGVPAYNWWNECLHGVARAGRATVFPQAIGLAAAFDAGLMNRAAVAISDEARAKHHEFERRGKRGIYQGLTFWTPNINLFRDPRWGRGMETYGEDPYLTGTLAAAFIKGLQGDDPKYLKVVATAKHFAVHSGPESERHTFDAQVSERDLRESYLPQFERAVKEGGAWSVMCAYNRLYGEAACASPRLLETILRKEWGFRGYVVTDCGAVDDIYRRHKVAATKAEASALAVKAGTDLDCGNEFQALNEAVAKGLAAEKDLDVAVKRLFEARFRLGMFDPPERVKWAKIPYSVNDSAAHGALALEAARKSMVLLKNEGGALPLKKGLKTLAVIGPNAAEVEVMLANYNGDPTAPVTPLEGIRRKVGAQTKVLYARGCDWAPGMPAFETVPAAALFHDEGGMRKAGLKGEYFDKARFAAEQAPVFTRVDAQVNFKWWDGSPRKDLKDDDFGVRWTGQLVAPVSGTYRLGASGFNGFELYLDGNRVARFYHPDERGYGYGEVKLEAGKAYGLRLESHHALNDADIRLVWQKPGEDLEGEALKAARAADAVVMVLGLSPRLEGEQMSVPVEGFAGGDRVTLGLPKVQDELLAQVLAVGKPVVVVLMNGSAVAAKLAWERAPAVLEAWYPGQAGGTAIADVLFGDYNPGGRLPVTFYESEKQLPAFNNYDMAGRTYRFFQGEPLWAFGHGLSYTKFTYGKLAMAERLPPGQELRVSVEVANAGRVPGEEVVQVYVTRVGAAGAPLRTLAGYARVALKPGERKTVPFTVEAKMLGGGGPVEIAVGGQQPLAKVAATTQVLKTRVDIAAR
ncbi:MAG: glycoside hydrolase family 3 C-terminal domain-containing protein [Acidobacteria bacterium]|nr:glycoside hydrolase family 3 C-terminal domain-containing protein [Acidobacteriota bacterium]